MDIVREGYKNKELSKDGAYDQSTMEYPSIIARARGRITPSYATVNDQSKRAVVPKMATQVTSFMVDGKKRLIWLILKDGKLPLNSQRVSHARLDEVIKFLRPNTDPPLGTLATRYRWFESVGNKATPE
jgi:hypothetical protein